MKILVATDGSQFSDKALASVAQRPWPADSEIEILYVVHSPIPDFPDPLLMLYAARMQRLDDERKHAQQVLEKAEGWLREQAVDRSLKIDSRVLEGSAKGQILDEAERWGADLIFVGSHGREGATRFLLGSVSQAVATHAHCSVEIIR